MMSWQFLFYCSLILFVNASPGDNHYAYRACLNHCKQINCGTSLGLQDFREKQTFFEYILRWSCPDECSYECMWKTVDEMQLKDEPVVQFHGKKF